MRAPRAACARKVSSRLPVKTRCCVRTSAIPATTRTPSTTSAATAVMRNRTVPVTRCSPISYEAVPETAHGPNRGVATSTELAPQAADVDLDDVGVALEVVFPDAVQHVVLREDPVRSPEEELEKVELARRELDFVAAAPHSAGVRIDTQLAEFERQWLAVATSTREGAEPRDEHRERERLREVVVGAEIEGFGFVEVARFRGEHQHRRPVARSAQIRAHAISV